MRLPLAALALTLCPLPLAADVLSIQNPTIRFNLCIGQECADSESFPVGSDVLRLKSFNSAIEFVDASTNAGVPDNDWTLQANENVLNGKNAFFLHDATNASTPFTVEASSRSNSLYVDGAGDVGLGTAMPADNLHIVASSLAAIRMDAGSGPGTVSFRMGADSIGFFMSESIGATTNIPFSVDTGADTGGLALQDTSLRVNTGNSGYDFAVESDMGGLPLFVDTTAGAVGMGTGTPAAPLHVTRSDGSAEVLVENTAASPSAARGLFTMRNNGGSFFTLDNTNAGTTWFFVHENSAPNRFIITDGVADGPEMTLTAGGDVTIPGSFISGSTTLNVPDYVFGEDYALRPLSEVAEFVAQNRHLPDVPSAADIAKDGLDMTGMQMAQLQKIEELTLYALEQESVIAEMASQNAAQEARLQAQEEQLARLEAMIQTLASRP